MSLILTGIITGIIGYISYTAWALTGFGSAIIFQISWYFISLFYGNGDIVDGLLYLSIAGLAVNPYQAYLLHKYVYWKMVFIMIIGFVPFMLIGIQVLLYVKSPWLKRSLGILFLLQWFKMMYDQRQHEKQEEEEKNKRQNIENNIVNNIVNTTNNTIKKDGVLDKEEEDDDEQRVIEMKEGKLSIDNDDGNTRNNNIEIEIKDNLDDSNNNMDVTKITSSVLINNNVDTFEINDWKSILILLITSSFAGFLGGLFGTAGRFTSFFSQYVLHLHMCLHLFIKNMHRICIYLHPHISLSHNMFTSSLQYISCFLTIYVYIKVHHLWYG